MSTLVSTPYASYAEHLTNAEGTRFISKPNGSQFADTGGAYLRSCLVCSHDKPATGASSAGSQVACSSSATTSAR